VRDGIGVCVIDAVAKTGVPGTVHDGGFGQR